MLQISSVNVFILLKDFASLSIEGVFMLYESVGMCYSGTIYSKDCG